MGRLPAAGEAARTLASKLLVEGVRTMRAAEGGRARTALAPWEALTDADRETEPIRGFAREQPWDSLDQPLSWLFDKAQEQRLLRSETA